MAFLNPIKDIARRLRAVEPPPADFIYMIGYECWGVAMFGPGPAEPNDAAQASGPLSAPLPGFRSSQSSPPNGRPSR